jgi:radical SAM superfamily enzyme YgiQ (UPF0313 family)
VNVLLISLYDLGRQPFGLASAAAWLGEAGARIRCLDLAVEDLDETAVAAAPMIAVHVPMHTATRLACALLPRLRALNAEAHLCLFGLYAPLNERRLRALGATSVIGGEAETGLVELYCRLATAGDDPDKASATISLAKQRFRVPDRSVLPEPTRYAHVITVDGARLVAGHTEASRGCKHLCRHCPIPPVYGGRFRVVQADVVIEDIRRQVAAGVRHVTFGDPDFFNGVGHAIPIVAALHDEFPELSYDVTIKIEHLLEHARHLPRLAETGCLFVTSAVESVDDRVLALLDKGHTRADFEHAVKLMRDTGLTLAPTFVPFTPWTTLDGYLDLLRAIVALDLVESVAPIQLAIRLLVPLGSGLIEILDGEGRLGGYDETALCYRWKAGDPAVDRLHAELLRDVEDGEAGGLDRREIFRRIWQLAHQAAGVAALPVESGPAKPVPRLSEPWYCCAEPTSSQLAGM